jgi:ABC-2 type transport system ATP-binding protein
MVAVECSHLTKVYGDMPAVDDLSFSVEEGEVFGFLGPNGAGKTTTIRMLLGLSRPDGGGARIFDSPVPAPPAVLSRVGALVEEPAFYSWMTPIRHLTVLDRSGHVSVGRAGVMAALERVDLEHAGGKRIAKLSQGMRQRLGLAAALLNAPDLLILDEPANGLDPAGIGWLRELIGEVARAGASVLLSSHQLGEIERVCDRVAILDRGRLVETGPIDQVGEARSRVRVTVRAENHEAALGALARFSVTDGHAGLIFVADADVPHVAKALADRGLFPEAIAREQSSLEQRFLELTGARS